MGPHETYPWLFHRQHGVVGHDLFLKREIEDRRKNVNLFVNRERGNFCLLAEMNICQDGDRFDRSERLLFSPKQKGKPGPKGPTEELIHAVVEMKKRNPSWGCPQIADQINLGSGLLLIRMSFDGSLQLTTDRPRIPTVHHG